MPDRGPWKPGLTHIGTQKQLFLDDYRIESLQNAAFVLNPAVKYRDKAWEGNAMNYGAVLYDEQDQLFRMWTTSTTWTPSASPKKSWPQSRPKLASASSTRSPKTVYTGKNEPFHPVKIIM